VAGYARRAGGGRQGSGEDPHRGGFAGAIGSEKCQDLAFFDGEGHIVDRGLGAVAFGEMFDLDHGGSTDRML